MRISINMAMTMDGKIASKERGSVKLGTSYDSKRMGEIRALHDAVLNGATTFKAHPFPLWIKDRALVARRIRKGESAQPISAIVSSGLKIPRHTAWEKAKGERWVFCGTQASMATGKSLEKAGVKVFVSGAKRPRPTEILEEFRKAGVKRLLLEGGGELNASFMEAGLVDTIYLTLVPKVLGGSEAPTWLEGRGMVLKRFSLKKCRKVGDELYLEYSRL